MVTIEHNTGTTIVRRKSEYQPPSTLKARLLGRPLPTADAPHQTIGKAVGLAVFASDALSSTAYATQEILTILVLAGAAAMGLTFPITIAIVVLLTIVTISYEQTIHAYPGGGGAYIVARDNLGELPAQITGAALLTDYILTVAVSVSSGVAQIASAYPLLYPYRVVLAVMLVGFIMFINLRGVKESGSFFAIPTYFFIVMMYLTVGMGLYRYLTGQLGTVTDPPELQLIHEMQPLTLFLILRAFASGTAALTGVEAISNGITAFKEPRSRNAGITLIWMSVILGTLVLSISFLATQIQAVPSEYETVISQIARTVLGGRGLTYVAMMSSAAIILIMAANTAFADFPRLGALHAGDGFLPRQMTYRGSRLVYSRGIVALAVIASALIIAFKANVTRLIPLYAIGVFLSFTLSQTGMAIRWLKIGRLKPDEVLQEPGSVLRYDPNWAIKFAINAFGALSTFIVMIIFVVTKFLDGAWIIVILMPLLVSGFFAIHHHYKTLAAKLSLENYGTTPHVSRHRVILLIGGVHRGSLAALRYARTLSNDVTAIHVSIDPEEAEKIRQKWETWGEGIRLVILDSPYRLLLEPLLAYIEYILQHAQPNEQITIVVPEFVSRSRWAGFLHMRTAQLLRAALTHKKGLVVVSVPYIVDTTEEEKA